MSLVKKLFGHKSISTIAEKRRAAAERRAYNRRPFPSTDEDHRRVNEVLAMMCQPYEDMEDVKTAPDNDRDSLGGGDFDGGGSTSSYGSDSFTPDTSSPSDNTPSSDNSSTPDSNPSTSDTYSSYDSGSTSSYSSGSSDSGSASSD